MMNPFSQSEEILFTFEHGEVRFNRRTEAPTEWRVVIRHCEGSPIRPIRVLPPSSDFLPNITSAMALYSAWIADWPVED
jgi:hypothetical protein